MADIAQVGFAVEGSGLKSGEAAVDAFTVGVGRRFKRMSDEVDGAVKRSNSALGRYRKELENLQSANDNLDRQTRQVAQGMAFEIAQRQRSTREQHIHNQMRAAGVDAASREGKAIAALAARHYDLTQATAKTTAGTHLLNAAQVSTNTSLGNMIVTLARGHPVAIAFAAGLGVAALAFTVLSRSAMGLAETSGNLVDFSETTGFTILQLQALNKAGAQVGLSNEKIATSFERFTAMLDEARDRTGPLYDELRKLDVGLANQLASTKTSAEAWDVLRAAMEKAGTEGAVAISRLAFGRGGAGMVRLAGAGATAEVVKQLKEIDRIADEQAKRWDTLGDKITENMKIAKTNIASIFTEDVLQAMERFSTKLADASRTAKEFAFSEDFKSIVAWLKKIADVKIVLPEKEVTAIGSAFEKWLPTIRQWVATFDKMTGSAFKMPEMPKITVPAANDNEAVKATTDALEKLNIVREKAINDLLKYQKMAAEPGNTFFKEDAEQAKLYGAQLDQIEQKIAEVKKAQAQPADPRPDAAPAIDKEAEAQKNLAEQQEEYKRALRGAYNEMSKWMGALGAAATIEQKYQLELARIGKAQADNELNTSQAGKAIEAAKRARDQEIASIQESIGVSERDKFINEEVAKVRTAAAQAGLSDEKTRLALIIAQREASERWLQTWARANPIMASLKDGAQSFSQSLASGLLQGKSLMDSLTAAAENLAQSMANSAISNLFQGNFALTGVQGAVSVPASLFTKRGANDNDQQRPPKAAA
jgi:hypothetical protein